ncbi:Transcriptional regulator, MerR family [hydrothermal vent metagenome]|uniref:Transcriptional regulator, MerR family n=1 Tax=hydrothermal vent metagenome TaxID=652676 RepID=A0A3B0ZTU3_9ZZZZ
MLTVSGLSKLANVTADSVRHYVRIGLLNPKRNQNNGYKIFEGSDIKKVKFIRQAKALGFTLSDISKILNHSYKGKSACPVVRKIIEKHIEENNVKVMELVALQKRMEDALKQWQTMPDGEPDGHAICYLIESIKL